MARRVTSVLVFLLPLKVSAQQLDLPASVDRIFARFTMQTPGCTVALGKDGKTLYTHGYGSANLEYGVPLTDTTVMESGSVAKQFTAAAVVLLQQDGKLSLDDDIRKYLPEVPNFGSTITIRHLLTHTSGLRDQWGLLGIEGRGPGQQVHSPATTLDLVVHQKQLNFAPGSSYLYSNTGYVLAGIIIQRVSGKSLQDFSRERLFAPLGMTHTQWRDDFTRIVPTRATAYAPTRTGFRQDMPFTNMVGNGGLLSTMADLLKWNENLDNPVIGGKSFVETMQTSMRLTNGRTLNYALGVGNNDYDGVREVSHDGSTAGYRTFLARYPDQRVSVAVWCNHGGVNAGTLGHQVADLVLTKPSRPVQAGMTPAVRLTPSELSQWAGLYIDTKTYQDIMVVANDSALTAGPNALVPIGPARFRTATGEVTFAGAKGRRSIVVARSNGDTTRFSEATPARKPLPLSDYVGRYASDELDVVLTVAAQDGKLMLKRRPDDVSDLTPIAEDSFQGGPGGFLFRRDAKGAVTGFSIFAGRVLDVRFKKLK